MSHRFRCPHCQKILKAPAGRIGAAAKCPACTRSFTLSQALIEENATDGSQVVTATLVPESSAGTKAADPARTASHAAPKATAAPGAGNMPPSPPPLPPGADSSRYWLLIGDKTHGPQTAEEIRENLSGGRFGHGALVCAVGESKWRPIGTLIAGGAAPPAVKPSSSEPGSGWAKWLNVLAFPASYVLLRIILKSFSPGTALVLSVGMAVIWFLGVFLLYLWKRVTDASPAAGAPLSPFRPADDVEWWVSVHDRPTGPFSTAALSHAVSAGDFSPNTPACPVGASAWRPLGDWPQFNSSRSRQ